MASKDENFSDWYNDIIVDAGLIDKRYPVKGMDTWLPYGLGIRNLVHDVTHDEMRRTEHDEYEFPLLIPKTEFQKEADHIEGFDAEVFWVTHGGTTELDEPLLLRPTSETAMYPLFAEWIRSDSDLPFKTYQMVNTFRYETEHTRSFIRVREIDFFEAHTAHEDYDSAEDQIVEDMEILDNVSGALCIPFTTCQRPEWDKFPGAHYTIGADVLMPDMRTLQIASVHHYKTNFAKPYDVDYIVDVDTWFEQLAEDSGLEPDKIAYDGKFNGPLDEGGGWTGLDVTYDGTTYRVPDVVSDESADLANQSGPGEFDEVVRAPEDFVWEWPEIPEDHEGPPLEIDTPDGTLAIPFFAVNRHVHQTTYGMSERLVGAVVGVHGDDQGLRMPPKVAPTQVVIVPVIFDEDTDAVLDACRQAREELEQAGLRVEFDDRDKTAGFKYNHWEQKGVPLRVEIGPRDLENDNAVLVPRDARVDDISVDSDYAVDRMDDGKLVVPRENLTDAVHEQLDAFADRLRASADELLEDNLQTVKSIEETKEQSGVLRTWWCGDESCAEEIETEGNKDVLGFPRSVEDGEPVASDPTEGACVACGASTDKVIYMARSY
jgi:prolyl-tRNA synthetase